MEVIIALSILAGMCFGVGLSVLIFVPKRTIGTLRIDRSDPTEAPYLFLDLDEPVDKFSRQKRVIVKVCDKNYISQK